MHFDDSTITYMIRVWTNDNNIPFSKASPIEWWNHEGRYLGITSNDFHWWCDLEGDYLDYINPNQLLSLKPMLKSSNNILEHVYNFIIRKQSSKNISCFEKWWSIEGPENGVSRKDMDIWKHQYFQFIECNTDDDFPILNIEKYNYFQLHRIHEDDAITKKYVHMLIHVICHLLHIYQLLGMKRKGNIMDVPKQILQHGKRCMAINMNMFQTHLCL